MHTDNIVKLTILFNNGHFTFRLCTLLHEISEFCIAARDKNVVPTRNMQRLYEKSKKLLNVMLQIALMQLDGSNINRIVYPDCVQIHFCDQAVKTAVTRETFRRRIKLKVGGTKIGEGVYIAVLSNIAHVCNLSCTFLIYFRFATIYVRHCRTRDERWRYLSFSRSSRATRVTINEGLTKISRLYNINSFKSKIWKPCRSRWSERRSESAASEYRQPIMSLNKS